MVTEKKNEANYQMLFYLYINFFSFIFLYLDCGILNVEHVCVYLKDTKNWFDAFDLIQNALLVELMTVK